MDTNNKIKTLMIQNDWTEYKLAKKSGLSQSTIKNIFKRNNVPTVATIEKICLAFGLTLSQFFAGENDLVSLNDSEKELITEWSHLSQEQKQAILQLIKTI